MPENIKQRRRHPAGGHSTSNCGETVQFSTEEALQSLYVRMVCASLCSFESEVVGDVELEVDIRKTRRSG